MCRIPIIILEKIIIYWYASAMSIFICYQFVIEFVFLNLCKWIDRPSDVVFVFPLALRGRSELGGSRSSRQRNRLLCLAQLIVSHTRIIAEIVRTHSANGQRVSGAPTLHHMSLCLIDWHCVLEPRHLNKQIIVCFWLISF